MIYGKVPPQAKDLEEAVLGAVLQFSSALGEAQEIINEKCFYVDAHQRIFRAMISLSQKLQPIDILTVTEELRKSEDLEKIGGAYYVTKLTNSVVSSANIQFHCRIILQKYIQREVIRISGELIGMAYEDSTDAFDLLDEAETSVYAIRQESFKKQFNTLDGILVKVIQELEDLRNRDLHLTGVTSGFSDLDYVTCGWQPTDLLIIAARPSVGKTAFALNLARNAAVNNPATPVAFFSLEMKDKKLIHRMLSSESEVWIWNLTNARLDDEKMKQLYTRGIQKLASVPIIIDDTSALNIMEFRAKARRLVSKHKVGLIIVDYLQLMTAPAHITNREQQISYISRELKASAGELNIPIIALSQLNRDIDKTKGREPQLSDLRESGAIEQDADLVMFLWRPSEEEIKENSTLGEICYAGIKKHRNGALGKFIGNFKKEIQRWNYLKIVDENTLQPLGSNWKPVTIPQGTIDFTESKKKEDTDTEMPF